MRAPEFDGFRAQCLCYLTRHSCVDCMITAMMMLLFVMLTMIVATRFWLSNFVDPGQLLCQIINALSRGITLSDVPSSQQSS